MEIVPQIESGMHFIVDNIETLTNPSGQIDGNDFLLQLIKWLSHTVWIQKWPQLLDPHQIMLRSWHTFKQLPIKLFHIKLNNNKTKKYTMNAANEQNSNQY